MIVTVTISFGSTAGEQQRQKQEVEDVKVDVGGGQTTGSQRDNVDRIQPADQEQDSDNDIKVW